MLVAACGYPLLQFLFLVFYGTMWLVKRGFWESVWGGGRPDTHASTHAHTHKHKRKRRPDVGRRERDEPGVRKISEILG